MENQNTPARVNFELSLDEFNFIRAVLGDLPTKSNAWVLLNNLERQARAQVPTPAEAETKVGGSD